MGSLKTWQERGQWLARCDGCACMGTGDSELDAVKSLARGLRNRLATVFDAARVAVEEMTAAELATKFGFKPHGSER
jgi:hypothetical protein